jgi:hypothetical protein
MMILAGTFPNGRPVRSPRAVTGGAPFPGATDEAADERPDVPRPRTRRGQTDAPDDDPAHQLRGPFPQDRSVNLE